MDETTEERVTSIAQGITDRARRFRGGDGLDTLCAKCNSSHIYRLKGSNQHTVHCTRLEQNVPPLIEECNRFKAIGTVDIWDLVKIAKDIDLKERKVGIQV